MSAIAGVWDRLSRHSHDALAVMAERMADAMGGPCRPGETLWRDASQGVGLAHRPLSAVDRASIANQPLFSSCGRFVVVCDGEIYNAGELAGELRAAGRQFPRSSEAEVIVEGAAAWGVEAMARRLDAALAAALWDRERGILYLLRDRLGLRPLYWAWGGGAFLFASELKALRACPAFKAELDRDALAAYLRRRSIPGPYTIYRGARMLEPGAILMLKTGRDPEICRYWSLTETVAMGQANRFAGSEAEAGELLDQLLRAAVERRIGNEPVGTFLSGGIDSSAVLAILHAVRPKQARSFSVGFHERQFDETEHAGAVARHLGVAHEALYISAEHASELIPALPEMYDEPMADVAQIPTFFLARLARQHVPAAFTGDGGEHFGCYESSLWETDVRQHSSRLPKPMRSAAETAIRMMPDAVWRRLSVALPAALRPTRLGERLRLLARVLAGDVDDNYRLNVSYWHDPEAIVPGGREPAGLDIDRRFKSLIPDAGERVQYFAALTTLPDAVLTKLDRVARATGLEFRMPFLDRQLVDFSAVLPPAMKLHGRTNKWLLRQVLDRYVPAPLIDRPKMGLDVPIGAWLRGSLRGWAEDLLDGPRLAAEGVFDPRAIRRKWQEHLDERRNWQGPLWIVLMFQAWQQRWLPRA